MPYQPIYEPFDLGAFDAALSGEVISILRNPTRQFRIDFFSSQGEALACNIAFICGASREQLEQLFGPYDAALFVWLFIGAPGQLPHVYAIWDQYIAERIKKLNAAPASSSAGETAAPRSTPASG